MWQSSPSNPPYHTLREHCLSKLQRKTIKADSICSPNNICYQSKGCQANAKDETPALHSNHTWCKGLLSLKYSFLGIQPNVAGQWYILTKHFSGLPCSTQKATCRQMHKSTDDDKSAEMFYQQSGHAHTTCSCVIWWEKILSSLFSCSSSFSTSNGFIWRGKSI